MEKKLEKYNSHWFKDLQGGPLGPQEVLNTQNSLAKKDYFYGCKNILLNLFVMHKNVDFKSMALEKEMFQTITLVNFQ